MQRGADFSSNNALGMPFQAWSLDFVYARASIGYRADSHYPANLQEARGAGVLLRGAYHYMLNQETAKNGDVFTYDPATACRIFLNLIETGLVGFCVLDLEAGDLTEPLVRRWVDYYFHHGTLPLYIYGSAQSLDRILLSNVAAADTAAIGALITYYARIGLIVSDYGYVNLATDRRSAPPPQVAGRPHLPRLPAIWSHLQPEQYIWQACGDNGRLAPWPDRLDLDFYSGSRAQLEGMLGMTAIAETLIGGKLGVGQVESGPALQFIHHAADINAPLAGAFGMNNAGVAIDAAPLVAWTLTRIEQDATDAAPGMDQQPSDESLRAMAARQILPYTHLSVVEKASARFIVPWNEPRPNSIAGYIALTKLMAFTADAAEAEGFRIAAYALNAGTPEWDEGLAIFGFDLGGGVRINERLLRGRHAISLHVGVLDYPGAINPDRMDATILGCALLNKQTGVVSPWLANADPLVTRYRFLLLAAQQLGVQVAPLFFTETYPALRAIMAYPVAEIVRRYAWLDGEVSLDPEVVAFFPYAVGRNGVGLPASDHASVWPALVDYNLSVASRRNATRGDAAMPISKQKYQELQAAQGAAKIAQQAADQALARVDAVIATITPDADGPAPLYSARVLSDLVLRDAQANPAHDPVLAPTGDPGGVVKVGTVVQVFQERVAISPVYKDRAVITPGGLNVWMGPVGGPATLQRL